MPLSGVILMSILWYSGEEIKDGLYSTVIISNRGVIWRVSGRYICLSRSLSPMNRLLLQTFDILHVHTDSFDCVQIFTFGYAPGPKISTTK